MSAQPVMITISAGPNGEKWYHLNGRLFGAHRGAPVPTVAELGLGDFDYAANSFQEYGRALEGAIESSCENARFAEIYGADRHLWLTTARLWTAAGEAGELVAAALAEAAGVLADAELADRTSPALAGFLVEGAAQYLVGMGHDLANAALRVAADNGSASALLSASGKKMAKSLAAARAGGGGREAWIFQAETQAMAKALGSSATGAARMVKVVARLERTAQWQQMSQTRHEYFHRVRFGYASGDSDALAAARDFYDATVDAAATLARAAPALYHTQKVATPKVRSGPGRYVPLIGAMSVHTIARDGSETLVSADLFPSTAFRG